MHCCISTAVTSVLVPTELPTTILAHAGGAGTGSAPKWLVLYGTLGVILLAYAYVRATFRTPELSQSTPSPATFGLDKCVRILGLMAGVLGVAVLLLALAAGWLGTQQSVSNIAPLLLFIVAWYVPMMLSAVFGDVYWALNPFRSAVCTLRKLGVRFRHRDHAAPGWTAPVMVGGFVWYEFAYFDSFTPRNCAAFISLYCLAAICGVAAWGPEWLDTGEGFGVLFTAIGRLGILGRDPYGRLVKRRWGHALARESLTHTQVVTLIVVLSGFAFDLMTSLSIWTDISGNRRGWALALITTIGLVWTAAVITVVWLVSCKRSWWAGAALVPMTVGLVLAHNYRRILTDLQNIYGQASDPFGRGHDIFGTINFYPSSFGQSAESASYIQGALVAIFTSLAVVVLHDRSVQRAGLRGALSEATGPLLCIVGAALVSLNMILGG